MTNTENHEKIQKDWTGLFGDPVARPEQLIPENPEKLPHLALCRRTRLRQNTNRSRVCP